MHSGVQFRLTAFFVVLCGLSANALAQAPDAKAPPTAPPTAAAPAANANKPAAAEFQRVLDEWKTMLKDLRNLKVQYQSAALADQAIIQQKWKDLVEKGNEKVA